MSEVPSFGFHDPLSSARSEWDPGGRVLRVSGEVDLSNAHRVLGVLDDLEEPSPVVDLTRVEFMDSTALSVLVEIESRREGEVRLMVAPRSQVDRLLDLTGLRPRFSVEVVCRRG